MLKLRMMEEFEKAIYHGFTLQKGFWYGVDTETGKYIATSGWECNGYVAVYFKNESSWDMEWVDVEADFDLENIPEVNQDDKMSFNEWLGEVIGVTPEYFDNNYDGDEEYKEYNSYLYDGLPEFVINYLNKADDEDC